MRNRDPRMTWISYITKSRHLPALATEDQQRAWTLQFSLEKARARARLDSWESMGQNKCTPQQSLAVNGHGKKHLLAGFGDLI